MGKTAFQKIIDSHCAQTLPDGRMVLKLDRVWCHEITTPNAILDAQVRGCDVVFDPGKVKTMIDHVNPAKDTASAIQGKIVREWSREHKVEFLEVGRNGICHAIIPEKGWIRPGQVGIMGDSHTCTHGAFCAFAAGVGTTELESGIITGLWVCPPQKVIRANFVGVLPANVYSKDLILTLISKIGVKGATNAVLEFGGPVVDKLSMDARMTMTNMAVECGATSGMMMVDAKTVAYLWPIFGEPCDGSITKMDIARQMYKCNSDSDAVYDQTIEINVTNMAPVITQNYSPGDVVPVAKLAGKPVNQVYIGSCTNGRLEDLRIAARLFQLAGPVSDNVRCVVVPATQHIYEAALEEGLIKTFIDAGCFVSGPTCGACLGMSCGILAPGEVCVSTTNRNFPGRMGEGGMVHLVSPATAAATAICGEISFPAVEPCEDIASGLNLPPVINPISLTGWRQISAETPDYGKLSQLFTSGEVRNFSGKVSYLLAADVDTDQIIPAKYLTETKKSEFGKHCLEGAPMSIEERARLFRSQMLVAKENFGCGSSREHAPWALEAAGIRCVIAPSFARIFENNMFANGLLCIALPANVVSDLFLQRPDTVNIDWEKGTVRWGDNHCWDFRISDYQNDLIRNNGGVGVMVKIAAELQKEGKI